MKSSFSCSNTIWTHLRILLCGRAPVVVGQLGKQGGQLLCEAPQARLVLLQAAAPDRERMSVGCQHISGLILLSDLYAPHHAV